MAILLSPFKSPLNQQLIMSWAGLRGAASIVFAIVAVVSPNYADDSILQMNRPAHFPAPGGTWVQGVHIGGNQKNKGGKAHPEGGHGGHGANKGKPAGHAHAGAHAGQKHEHKK